MPATDADRQLRGAVLATVSYADLFDFPLDSVEIHRDLVGVAATLEATGRAIDALLAAGTLARDEVYPVLPGRTGLAALRRDRRARATQLWPRARRFGRILARYPFVRLVAVSGSLAAENPDGHADLDYLIVTTPGRLWSVRALAIGLVRLARGTGLELCPNYLLTTRALAIAPHDLYTAHELLQIVPLSGMETYRQLLDANAWAAQWLPNRYRQAVAATVPPLRAGLGGRVGERALGGSLGDRLERWEARRKRARLGARGGHFTEDVCEGHYGKHREWVLGEFQVRCARAGVVLAGLEAANSTEQAFTVAAT